MIATEPNQTKGALYSAEMVANFNQQTFEHLLVEEKDHLLTLTLNRPEKKNALNPVLFKELAYALSYAHHNNDIWGVVIGANGDVFCAGADLKSFASGGAESISTIPDFQGEIVLGDIFTQLHKPSIAKVQGPVLAGGFLIICGCTHVIAAETATFGLPEVKRGLFAFQVMASMLQVMPARQVLDFCIRARTVNSQEAEKMGLITQAVSIVNLESTVANLVNEIFQYSPTAIRMGLRAFDEMRSKPAAEVHSYLKQMLYETIQTEDAAEGLTAFMEKRAPQWKGK